MKLAQGTLGLFCLFGAIQPVMAEDEPDPKTLYDLSTEGSTQKVKAGENGVAVVWVRAQKGGPVSCGTPPQLEAGRERVKGTQKSVIYAASVAPRACWGGPPPPP